MWEGGGSPAAGVPELGALSRPVLPPEDTTSARPRLRNWSGGALGVGRKDGWVGADSRGAPGWGQEQRRPVGGGAGQSGPQLRARCRLSL